MKLILSNLEQNKQKNQLSMRFSYNSNTFVNTSSIMGQNDTIFIKFRGKNQNRSKSINVS